MPKYTLCKIKPNTPFHLGTEAELEKTSVTAHSDTLFSALTNTYRLLYGNDALEWLNRYPKDPPFLITSTFPYVEDTLLYPLPKHLDISKFTEEIKTYKKVEYISESLFNKVILNDLSKNDLKEDNLAQHKRILLTDEEREKYCTGKSDNDVFVWILKENPRVRLDRKTSASEIYHVGDVCFAEACGLFFLIDLKDARIGDKLKATIRLFGDEGLGGERTAGKGLFDVEFTEGYELPSGNGDVYTSLSLMHPNKEEIDGLKGYYESIIRRGWIYSPDGRNLRRKAIRMFVEGSSFNKKVVGKLEEVAPKGFTAHQVYRYGMGFFVQMEGSI